MHIHTVYIQTIEDDDIISFNSEFTSKFRRIRVPLLSSRDTPSEERETLPAAVDEDRKHMVEAVIVRVMKARRRLNHADLVAETTRLLMSRFHPSPPVSL
jgi:cullin 3